MGFIKKKPRSSSSINRLTTDSKNLFLVGYDTSAAVLSISASHYGTRVVTGSDNGQVCVRDVRTGTLLLEPLLGHAGRVWSVAWSHDDSRIVSGSDDNTIRIWDVRAGGPVGMPLKGHTGPVYSVAFSSDSTSVVSGSNDHTIRVWDVRTGSPIARPFIGHTGTVYSVAFSHDDARIVSGSADHTINIWDTRTGALTVEPLRDHKGPVMSVAFSPNSTRIISGSRDCTIQIWDGHTGAPIVKLPQVHTGPVESVAFSPDSTRIVSGSADHTICIWDMCTSAAICDPLRRHTRGIQSVAFLPDSTHFISGSWDRSICFWEVPKHPDSSDAAISNTWTSPSFDMVTSNMSAQDMFECLAKHGCADLSLSVDSNRYSVSAIASGGFGDVWQAWMKDGTLVAVKCLRLHMILDGDRKGMKRTMRELYNWSKAQHENIQQLLGIVIFQGKLGMVSIWRPNGNLQQYIEKYPSVERYPLCIQLTKGVAYLHGIGMVHGDIKAINILVCPEGIVKITDFDYSVLSESTLRFSETTKLGGGTIRWMAPELLLLEEDEGAPRATHTTKTDVYALGMTMLEIISGKVPYHQFQHDRSIILALDKKRPPRCPEELSGPDERTTRIWALFLECWDHDPEVRPNAPSLLNSLQSLGF